jgi:hypothetical protein
MPCKWRHFKYFENLLLRNGSHDNTIGLLDRPAYGLTETPFDGLRGQRGLSLVQNDQIGTRGPSSLFFHEYRGFFPPGVTQGRECELACAKCRG